MKRSEVVTALANLASQGTYQVKPTQAAEINAIFEQVAQLINELESEEKVAAELAVITNEDNNNE